VRRGPCLQFGSRAPSPESMRAPCVMSATMNATVKQRKSVIWTLRTCAVILLFTAMGKLLSGFGSSKLLTMRDPLFGISYRHLMWAVGSIEIVVAAAMTAERIRLEKRTMLLVWLVSMFGLYRLALVWLGADAPCSCLGSFGSALGLSRAVEDALVNAAFYALVIGSGLLVISLLRGRHITPVNLEKGPV